MGWFLAAALLLAAGGRAAGAGSAPRAAASGRAVVLKQTLTSNAEIGNASFGTSVAVSGDGKTAVVGGPSDAKGKGAVWVFSRSGAGWEPHGIKLTGSGEVGLAAFGSTVAISGDGDTVLVGAPFDARGKGAAWVFVRSGGRWTQQGSKLTGTPGFAGSVAISADGDTALVGGPDLNSDGKGVAWVFARSGSTWAQQGGRLTGSDESKKGDFGNSVALSDDGNTALIGGNDGFANVQGGVWVFTRSGSTWSQRGGPLSGSGTTGTGFGATVALSGDGHTAVVGSPADGDGKGAALVFGRSGTTWTQQGQKLSSGENGEGAFASEVALSGDGNTTVIGSPFDNNDTGAAWVFHRSGSAWTADGRKLTGGGDNRRYGSSVAVAVTGSTLLVGVPPTGTFNGKGGAKGEVLVYAD